jgi:hypothetical protein
MDHLQVQEKEKSVALGGCPETVFRMASADPSPPSSVPKSPVLVWFFGGVQGEGGPFLPAKTEFRDSLSARLILGRLFG